MRSRAHLDSPSPTIAVTGGSGRLGRAVVRHAVAQGAEVVSIDRVAGRSAPRVHSVTCAMHDFEDLCSALQGCDALIHLAALPVPGESPDHVVHNNNVVGSYTAMRAAVEVGITRICQASSVNAIGLSFSRRARFDYFPLDECHPTYAEDPYGLSKWICEVQADSIARTYAEVSIASLRFHWIVPGRAVAWRAYHNFRPDTARHLWAYTDLGAAVRACLLGVTSSFTGHEVFNIVAPESVGPLQSRELADRFYPHVPLAADFGGRASFFDSGKARRLLGWAHP